MYWFSPRCCGLQAGVLMFRSGFFPAIDVGSWRGVASGLGFQLFVGVWDSALFLSRCGFACGADAFSCCCLPLCSGCRFDVLAFAFLFIPVSGALA